MNYAAYRDFTDSLNKFFARWMGAPIFQVVEADKIGDACVCLVKRDEFTDSRLPARSPEHEFAIFELGINENGSFETVTDEPVWSYMDRWTQGGADVFGADPTFGTLSYEDAVQEALRIYKDEALALYRDFAF